MQANSPFQSFFTFTKNEKKGILVLLVIINVLLITRAIIVRDSSNQATAEIQISELDSAEIASGFNEIAQNTISRKKEDKPEFFNKNELFYFNPNEASRNELLRLGLSEFATANLLKYRESGGIFKDKEDLLKIYGVNKDLYNKLASFIAIHDNEKSKETNSDTFNKIEINSASESDLQRLPGIGKVLAARIVKYRDLLGGFHSVHQLVEVYGISDSLNNSLDRFLIADTMQIRQIDLNSVDEEKLISHPYISFYEARAIIKYRDLVGEFKKGSELKDNYLLSEEDYRKIKPYLLSNE